MNMDEAWPNERGRFGKCLHFSDLLRFYLFLNEKGV